MKRIINAWPRAALFFCAVLCPGMAQAGGFYIQEQSTAAMGTAFAGAGAKARDASVMYYNPAAITQLKKAQVSIGASALKAWSDNSDQGSTTSLFNGTPTPTVAPASGSDSDDQTPFSVLPNAYAAAPIPATDGQLWAGIGFSVPFGLSTNYDADWTGRFDSVKSELRVMEIQPTLAWRANDWLSIGGGVDVQRVVADLSNRVTNTVSEGTSELKGDDWDAGYNLGVLVTPADGTSIGFDYRSHVDHTLEGHAVVTGVPSAFGGAVPGLNTDVDASADLNLPDIYGLSVAQRIAPDLTLLGQINYFHWGVFNDITAESGGTAIETIDENYRDTMSYAVGAEYDWRPNLTLRAGYQYDETPTQSPQRDSRVFDGNRHFFNAGVGYDVTGDITINAAISYALIADANVDVARNGGLARTRIGRDDTSFAFGSVGLTYHFK